MKTTSLFSAFLLSMLFVFNGALEAGVSQGRYDSIKNAIDRWEQKCVSTNDLGLKKKHVNHLIDLQNKVDALGLTGDVVVAYEELCGGLFNQEITSIEVTPQDPEVLPGDGLQLSASISKMSCTEGETPGAGCAIHSDCGSGVCLEETLVGDITWGSDDAGIATVDQNGFVRAVSEGVALISVVSNDLTGISGSSNVHIIRPVDVVEVVPVSATVGVGYTQELEAILVDPNGNIIDPATRTITWSTSDPGIATVIGNGSIAVLTAQVAGTATITASSEGKSGTSSITVADICVPLPDGPDCTERVKLFEKLATGAGYDSGVGIIPLTYCSNNNTISCGSDSDCPSGGTCIPISPQEEVYVDIGFTLGCCAAPGCTRAICPDPVGACCSCLNPTAGGEYCPFIFDTCGYYGGYAEYRIVDQNGNQLNWNSVADSACPPQAGCSKTGSLWDRGNAGSCGHPSAVEIAILSRSVCWGAFVEVYRRPGWNTAGTSFLTAPEVGPSSTWCGSINQAPCGGGSGGGYALECNPDEPECSEDAYWSVYLETGDTFEIDMDLYTEVYGGSWADLELHHVNDGFIKNFRYGALGGPSGTQETFTYTNTGAPATFFVVLNVRSRDLWRYSFGFSVKKAGCIEEPEQEECPSGCGVCESCIQGECVPNPVGIHCDDGNACSINDTCDYNLAGVIHCKSGETRSCDDSNPCTIDGCNYAVGCRNVAGIDGTSCSDGRFCNGEETCQQGVCTPGEALNSTELQLSCIELIDATIPFCESLNNWRVEVFIHDKDGNETTDYFCSEGRTGEDCANEGVQTDSSGFAFCYDGGEPITASTAGDLQCAVAQGEAQTLCEAICTGCIPAQ